MKYMALEALSKYNNDAALEGLKEGMRTTGDDIGRTAVKNSPNNWHKAFAPLRRPLFQSPHSGAIPFLLTQRNNSYSGVRVDVVHAGTEG